LDRPPAGNAAKCGCSEEISEKNMVERKMGD